MTTNRGQKTIRLYLLVICLLSAVIPPSSVRAEGLIRDAEIEDTLRRFADPIFTAAQLNPQNVHIFIVNEDVINSYVAGGQNIFVYTGLLLICDNPNMLLGVLAHETGHIAGGHLARGAEDLQDAELGSVLGFVLGAAVAVANSQAGMAVMTGSQSVIMRKALSYTRGHEQAADEAALRFLDSLNISASGMVEVFNILRRNQLRSFGSPDPYLQTHPLSGDRIAYIRDHMDASPIPAGQHPKELDMPLARLRAKLFAFINIPPKTFARYPNNDTSLPARMARAIAWYRMPDYDRANAEMKSLLKDYPNDAFLYDLNGQIQFENGHIPDALASYSKAAQLKPNSALILTSLGQAQLGVGKPAQAVTSLQKSAALDNTNGETWHLLATAYGAQSNPSMAALSLAEEAALENQPKVALLQADLALKGLQPGSPAYLRAQDLKREAEEMKRKAKEEKNS